MVQHNLLGFELAQLEFHYFMANRWGNSGNSERLYFGGVLQMVTAAMKLKDSYSLEVKL